MIKLLLTSTSFQDTPGKHQDELNSLGLEIDYLRGPLPKEKLLPIIEKYDALICGDDELNREVLSKGAAGSLRFISKYGVGLDKIDLNAASEFGIKVNNCLGANHVTVAEHVFALMLSFLKNICIEVNHTKKGNWKRITGTEIYGKTIAVLGLGKIGKEVAKRANAFGMQVKAFDIAIDEEFCKEHSISFSKEIKDIISDADIISINLPLLPETKGILNRDLVKEKMKEGVIIINTARADLIPLDNIIYGLDAGIIGGYLTDVLEKEPIVKNHPLLNHNNVMITPHIGSRTFESVERQGLMAVENLEKMMSEKK